MCVYYIGLGNLGSDTPVVLTLFCVHKGIIRKLTGGPASNLKCFIGLRSVTLLESIGLVGLILYKVSLCT